MGPKRVMWVRRYQGQCRALRPLGHQGYRLRSHNKDQPLCSGYTEKPLKTVLIHQNDHHRPKKRKVAFLEFDCNHFKGLHGRVLRRAVFQGEGGREA